MSNKYIYSLLTACYLSFSTASLALEVGSTMPQITINSEGEVLLKNNSTYYQSWNSEKLVGKIRTIQHIAGTSAAKKLNQHFIDAIKKAKLDPARYQTTTIINLNDAIFGTKKIVQGKAETKKTEYPHSSIVVDKKGSAVELWKLSNKNSAIIILDEAGQVLFFKEGAMSDKEVESTIKLIVDKIG